MFFYYYQLQTDEHTLSTACRATPRLDDLVLCRALRVRAVGGRVGIARTFRFAMATSAMGITCSRYELQWASPVAGPLLGPAGPWSPSSLPRVPLGPLDHTASQGPGSPVWSLARSQALGPRALWDPMLTHCDPPGPLLGSLPYLYLVHMGGPGSTRQGSPGPKTHEMGREQFVWVEDSGSLESGSLE